MSDNQNEEPYNGAAWGYSPYDMSDYECLASLDKDSSDEEYDCCDDAEDYTDDISDDEE